MSCTRCVTVAIADGPFPSRRSAERRQDEVLVGRLSQLVRELVESPAKKDLVIGLALTGRYTARELGDLLGISTKGVEQHLARAGISLREARREAIDDFARSFVESGV